MATETSSFKIDDKRIINGWAMFDWANSVYALVITSAIFPVYYHHIATSISADGWVDFLGWKLDSGVLYSYALSFSFGQIPP